MCLAGPGKEIDRPKQASGGFLTLTFNDIAEEREGLIAPSSSDAQQIISFVDAWDKRQPMLIFCWMGISRSTAAAIMTIKRTRPERTCREIAHQVRLLSPMATPNPLMISHADKIMQLDGSLTEAVADIGRGEVAFEGEPFSIELDF